jgi:putative (di)nucleoside polyphosphate hydrolase
MRFLGDDAEINVHTREPEFSEWRWLDIDTLPRLVVPFKRDTYSKVIAAFRDLARPRG